MAKFRTKTSVPEPPPQPHVGDKVRPPRSEMVYETSHVSHDGAEVNLKVSGTNLERFRVRTDTLTFVERKPPVRPSNLFTTAEPVFDADKILERIATIQEENLKRLNDDIDILKAHLKTQRAPKARLKPPEGLTVERHVSWKKSVDRIKKQLEE